MDLLEAVIAILLSSAGLLAAVTVSVRVSGHQSKQAFGILQTELNEEKQLAKDLRTRVSDLETKLNSREKRIEQLERDNRTILTSLEALQKWKVQAQADIEGKDAKITEQADKISELSGTNERLYKANDLLNSENGVYKHAIALLGIKIADESASTETKIEDVPGKPGETKHRSA